MGCSVVKFYHGCQVFRTVIGWETHANNMRNLYKFEMNFPKDAIKRRKCKERNHLGRRGYRLNGI